MVTVEFKEMALSYYGCDGGNLSSVVWTCGLEWGGGYENNQIKIEDIESLPLGAWDLNGESVLDYLRAQYNQKLAWFYCYLLGWDVSKYDEEAVKHKLFCSNGTGFKMNAFPISFKNRSSVQWPASTMKITGLPSFDVYKEWCIQKRGDFFFDIVKQHNPKLILCTGITYTMDFVRFFKCDLDSYRELDNVKFAVTNNGKSIVAVSPFFGGASGINSYVKMKALVDIINKECVQFFQNLQWANKT